MSLNCGIVGLPNVGKSTLFNAITNTTNAQAENYPFCTIEPNIGKVPVADDRLNKISKISNSQKIIPSLLEIVDIAGLVKGASKGEGLGNQFLGNIRQVDAILHVVRFFADENVTHVENSLDPMRDIEIINTELLLADIASLEKRKETLAKKSKNSKEFTKEIDIISHLVKNMNSGIPARNIAMDIEEMSIKNTLQLITNKPVVYIANVDEEMIADTTLESNSLAQQIRVQEKSNIVFICAKLEGEISEFSEDEKREMLSGIGAEHTGLENIAKAGYNVLNLITFFTSGEKETRSWSLKSGATAPQAAGVIHTDFERGFIKAETIGYEDFISLGGENAAKQAGRLRLEGKEYIVQDGDIMHFKFNV